MIAIVLLKLTLWEVLVDIPHDVPALVVYLLLGLFVFGIWYGSRSKPGDALAGGSPKADG